MATVDDFFERLIQALNRAEVPYMVTGSYASSAHGTPRATNDIDIVIAPTPAQLWQLMREFPGDRYYAEEEDAFEALERKSQFNIVDFATGWKADLIVQKDRAFSEIEFDRRRPHRIADSHVYLATAEDILIALKHHARRQPSRRAGFGAGGIAAGEATSVRQTSRRGARPPGTYRV